MPFDIFSNFSRLQMTMRLRRLAITPWCSSFCIAAVTPGRLSKFEGTFNGCLIRFHGKLHTLTCDRECQQTLHKIAKFLALIKKAAERGMAAQRRSGVALRRRSGRFGSH